MIVFYLNSAIYLCMMYYGFACLFKPATKKIWLFLAYGAFVLTSSGLFLHFGSEWMNLAFNTVAFLCIALLFSGNLGARFIFSLLLYILSIVADASAFAGLSYMYYRQYGTSMPLEFVLSVVRTVINIIFLPLLLISTIAFRRIFARKVRHSHFEVPTIYTISVFLLLLGIIVLNLFLIMAEINNAQISLVRIMISQFITLTIIFFVIWLYNTLLSYFETLEKNRQKDLALERWEIQYKAVSNAQKVVAELKHNLRYHFLTLLKYSQSGELQKIEKHIEAEIGAFDYIVHTGNLSIDAIVNYYKQRISEVLDIELKTDIWIPQNMTLNVSLTMLALGNALENAMEACEHVAISDRYIHLEANTTGNSLLLIVENSYAITPITDADNNLLTTKSDMRNHGLGLSSIQEILSGKVGQVDVEYADGKFRFKLLLHNVFP